MMRDEPPQIDFEPGDYRERKPKGWRWRLPWSHADDVKLPMVMFFICASALVAVFVYRDGVSPTSLFSGTLAFGFSAGNMLQLWLRD